MKYLLRGRIGKGMFPGESMFSVPDSRGISHWILVQDYALHEVEGDDGSLEVNSLDAADGIILVRLPGEALDENQNITVAEEQLRPLAGHSNGNGHHTRP